MKKPTQKELEEIQIKQNIASARAELNRARSVTIGTAFGGVTELSMRANDGSHLWCVMQPTEVIELIHQLAANVGCHIAVKPRKDFSSWREWKVSEAEKLHLNGHPPFPNDISPFNKIGLTGFDQNEAEKIVADDFAQKEYDYSHGHARKKESNHEPTMATKKTVNKRSIKRTAKAS